MLFTLLLIIKYVLENDPGRNGKIHIKTNTAANCFIFDSCNTMEDPFIEVENSLQWSLIANSTLAATYVVNIFAQRYLNLLACPIVIVQYLDYIFAPWIHIDSTNRFFPLRGCHWPLVSLLHLSY